MDLTPAVKLCEARTEDPLWAEKDYLDESKVLKKNPVEQAYTQL